MNKISYRQFNDTLCKINNLHNLVNKFIIKRNIYKKHELDDYKIHKRLVELFDDLTHYVNKIKYYYIITYNYYNGNSKNYLNNINTYLNKLKNEIWTKYYLDKKEEEKEKIEKSIREEKEKEKEKKEKQRKKKKKKWKNIKKKVKR